jgi:hypothetical protein
MQKMFKNLGLPKQESNMNEFEKKAKEAIEAEISQQANSFVKDIEPNAENQGYDSDEELSVNPFSGRELLPASGNGLSYVFDKGLNYSIVRSKESNINGGKVTNIPIITDGEDLPEDEGSMLNRLLYLSEFLNRKSSSIPSYSHEEWEDIKWETINETYCLITIDLPRHKAEIVKRYLPGRLITNYVAKDGTYYSKVTKGNVARGVILDLIKVYPWDNPDLVKVALGDGQMIGEDSPVSSGCIWGTTSESEKKKHLVNEIDKLSKAVNDLKDDIKSIFK